VATSTFGGPSASAGALIGRRVELSWLRARVDLALGGFPHLVIIEGEPGIGKTRLAHEALAHARRRDATVLRGRCYDHLDFSYLPFRDSLFAALAQHLAGRPGRDTDVALLGQLLARGDPEGAAGDTADGIEHERTRQLLALTELVLEYARDTPSVLFVDDIDWADTASVDLLRHLLFRLDDVHVPLLVLATSRADPTARASDGVARLRNEPRTAVVQLHVLSELEAVELARELRPGTGVDRARELAVASGGNPLLLDALGRERGGNSHAPGGSVTTARHPMTAAVESALAGLGASATAIVVATTVLTPDGTKTLVGALAGLPAAQVDDAVHEAVAAGVLVDHGTSVAFAHPVYEHTAYERAAPATRRALHAHAAALLCERDDPASARAIAHHLVAGDAISDADAQHRVRAAADQALAVGSWNEAARGYEAVLTAPHRPDDPAELHKLAGLSRRGNLQMTPAVAHFQAALVLAGDDADPATRAELHLWRIRCAIGTHELLGVVADRGPLEALVDEIEAEHPELAAEALVELSQSYWVEWRMKRATRCAQRAMAIAERNDDHSAYARATTALSVPQWAQYDLRGSLASLEDGVTHARAARDDSVLAGGPAFRVPLVLAWLGRFDEAEARALECCEIADRTRYPLELGLPLAALTQLSVARGEFDRAEQYGHRALLLQRLSGYHWAAGLFLPALACAHVARGQYDAAREALATWAETADDLEQASVDLFTRWVDACERRLMVQGAPLPGLPSDPLVGGDAWAALAVELAQREGASGDLRAARDLLVEIEARGGVLISGCATLAARSLGVAQDLLGEEEAAIATLTRAIEVAERLRAEPERARAQVDLAVIRLRRNESRRAMQLLDEAAATFRRLDMEPERRRAAQLSGAGTVASTDIDLVEEHATSVILFTDVVDSTRLTEELGAAHYRTRARGVERTVTGAILANGGTVVPGISLGDGFIGLFPTVDQAADAARRCTREVSTTGLHLHVAVHQGELIVDGDRIYGEAVNLVARVCALSGPDEILVSSAICDALAERSDFSVVDRGEHALKGIAAPQRVYALVTPNDVEPAVA
jgi:class 3 adenylate cyclase